MPRLVLIGGPLGGLQVDHDALEERLDPTLEDEEGHPMRLTGYYVSNLDLTQNPIQYFWRDNRR